MLVGVLFCPLAAFAKRAAPKPVSSVVHNGVEYRARVWDMGFVEAIDLASHDRLWRRRIYYVWYVPLAEKDCQDIFITSLAIQDGKLLVRNEAGKSYGVDLRTGHIEGAARYWVPWFCMGTLLLFVGFRMWKRL